MSTMIHVVVFTLTFHHSQETGEAKVMSHLVGGKLVVDFGVDGLFGGQVKQFSSVKGHLVKYDDGDEEWIKAILVSCLACKWYLA